MMPTRQPQGTMLTTTSLTLTVFAMLTAQTTQIVMGNRMTSHGQGTAMTTLLSLTRMESTVLGTPLTLSTVDTGTTPISLPQSHVALVAAKAIIALALMTLVWLIRMVMIAHGIQRILQDVEDTILQISLQAMRAVLVTVEMMEIDKMITTILTFMKIVKMILLPLIHMEMVALGTLKTRPDVELMMIQTLQLLKIAVPVAVELTMVATLVMRMRTMTTIVMMALQTKMDVLTTCL